MKKLKHPIYAIAGLGIFFSIMFPPVVVFSKYQGISVSHREWRFILGDGFIYDDHAYLDEPLWVFTWIAIVLIALTIRYTLSYRQSSSNAPQ